MVRFSRASARFLGRVSRSAAVARQIGASAFLLRPYEKQRLAKALADPRFAPE